MNLGPFALSTALLALLFGFIAAQGVAGFLRKRGQADASDALYWALGLALLAARVAYVVGWRQPYLEQPWSIFNLRDGGFDRVAGLLALALAAVLIGWRRPRLRKALLVSVTAGTLAWGLATLTAQRLRDAGRQPLPALTLRDVAGREVALASLRGKPLVVNLWATWCGPCRSELPMLVAAQQRLPAYRFVFVDQGEDAATVAAYLRRVGLAPRDVLIDANLDVAARYGVRGYPTTLFLDAGGVLRDRVMGELSRATLQDHLGRIGAVPSAGGAADEPHPPR